MPRKPVRQVAHAPEGGYYNLSDAWRNFKRPFDDANASIDREITQPVVRSTAAALRGDWNSLRRETQREIVPGFGAGMALMEGLAATPNGIINAAVRPITDAASNDLYNLGIGTNVSPEQNRERNNQIVGTVGGVASMFLGKVPIKAPDIPLSIKALPAFRSPFDMSGGRSALNVRKPYYPGHLKSHPDAHAISVHGGGVTDAQLLHRSRTGIRPDGKAAKIPEMSSAFHSDDYLRWVDETIRKSGALKAAAARRPDRPYIKVTAQDVGDLGVDVGRGYRRILAANNKIDNQRVFGPTERVGGLRSAEGYYQLNPLTGRWENITLFPTLYR